MFEPTDGSDESSAAEEPAELSPEQAQGSAVLTEDVPCRHCGYNLRGLMPGSNCPECNTAIALSIVGNALSSASPEWLAKVVRGIGIFFWGKLATIGMGIVWFIFFRRSLGAEVWQGFSLMMQAVVVLGVWLFTTADPGEPVRPQGVSAREIARITALCMLGVSAVEFCFYVIPLPDEMEMPVTIGLRVLGLGAIVAVASRLVFVARLAERLPDYRLARRARFLAIAISVTDGLVLVASLLALLFLRGGPRRAALIAFGCSFALVGLVLLVFLIMELILMLRMRSAVAGALEMARVRWEGIRRVYPAATGQSD